MSHLRHLIMMTLILGGLSACGERDPAAPDAAQNAQLDDAAAMLDDMGKDDSWEFAAANETGAAPEGTAPVANTITDE